MQYDTDIPSLAVLIINYGVEFTPNIFWDTIATLDHGRTTCIQFPMTDEYFCYFSFPLS